jgi:acyl-coenzyme A thioesterase PaaI-like protein
MRFAIMTGLRRAAERSLTAAMTTSFLRGATREDVFCDARLVDFGERLIHGVASSRDVAGALFTHHSLTYIRPEAPHGG